MKRWLANLRDWLDTLVATLWVMVLLVHQSGFAWKPRLRRKP